MCPLFIHCYMVEGWGWGISKDHWRGWGAHSHLVFLNDRFRK